LRCSRTASVRNGTRRSSERGTGRNPGIHNGVGQRGAHRRQGKAADERNIIGANFKVRGSRDSDRTRQVGPGDRVALAGAHASLQSGEAGQIGRGEGERRLIRGHRAGHGEILRGGPSSAVGDRAGDGPERSAGLDTDIDNLGNRPGAGRDRLAGRKAAVI